MDNLVENKVVIFRLGEVEFGVPIEQVQSIERSTTFTKIPSMPTYLRGMIEYRGKIMPVIDLVQLLQQRDLVETDLTRIITIHHQENSIGILVDAATDVLDISGVSIQQPSLMQNDDIPFFRGVANLPNRLLIIIDIHKLLSNVNESFNYESIELENWQIA